MAYHFVDSWIGRKKSQMFSSRTCMFCGEDDCRVMIGGMCRKCDAIVRRRRENSKKFSRLTGIYSKRRREERQKQEKAKEEEKNDLFHL